jgi:hypothetical protein
MVSPVRFFSNRMVSTLLWKFNHPQGVATVAQEALEICTGHR